MEHILRYSSNRYGTNDTCNEPAELKPRGNSIQRLKHFISLARCNSVDSEMHGQQEGISWVSINSTTTYALTNALFASVLARHSILFEYGVGAT